MGSNVILIRIKPMACSPMIFPKQDTQKCSRTWLQSDLLLVPYRDINTLLENSQNKKNRTFKKWRNKWSKSKVSAQNQSKKKRKFKVFLQVEVVNRNSVLKCNFSKYIKIIKIKLNNRQKKKPTSFWNKIKFSIQINHINDKKNYLIFAHFTKKMRGFCNEYNKTTKNGAIKKDHKGRTPQAGQTEIHWLINPKKVFRAITHLDFSHLKFWSPQWMV